MTPSHRQLIPPDNTPPFTRGDKVIARSWPDDYIGIVRKIYLYRKLTWTVEAEFPDRPDLVRMAAFAFANAPRNEYPPCPRDMGTRKKCSQCWGKKACLGESDDSGPRVKHDR